MEGMEVNNVVSCAPGNEDRAIYRTDKQKQSFSGDYFNQQKKMCVIPIGDVAAFF